MSAAQQLRLAVIAAALIVATGTVGYMYLEGWTALESLYMTIITLSTVGFGEVRNLHPESRLFTMGLIVFGVTLGGFLAATVGQFILEGQFKELVYKRKMEKKLSKLNDHCVVAGFGRVGRQVAKEFAKQKVPFVVIEQGEEAAETLMSLGYEYVIGDATDDDVLRHAGIERAKTLISTLPEEAQNVYLTLTARDLCSDLKVIARADFHDGEKKLRRAGATTVVIPHVLGGTRMAMAATRPNVVDFVQMVGFVQEGLMIEEIALPSGIPFDGKTIQESGLKKDYGITIIGLRKSGHSMSINPGPAITLSAGDILVLIGDRGDVERLNSDIHV
jgi:voltage-gated potassium channel